MTDGQTVTSSVRSTPIFALKLLIIPTLNDSIQKPITRSDYIMGEPRGMRKNGERGNLF